MSISNIQARYVVWSGVGFINDHEYSASIVMPTTTWTCVGHVLQQCHKLLSQNVLVNLPFDRIDRKHYFLKSFTIVNSIQTGMYIKT